MVLPASGKAQYTFIAAFSAGNLLIEEVDKTYEI